MPDDGVPGRVVDLTLIPHQDDLLADITSDTILDVAGLGCIAAGTRIYDPITEEWTPVEALHAIGLPLTVLALFDDGVARTARAEAPFIKGIAELFRFTCEDGSTITVTEKHRFLTPLGWRFAGELRAGCLLGSGAFRPEVTSRGGWTRICSVEPMGQGLYFDLTVPGPANYLAEGLWNHNSGKTTGIVIKTLDLAARNWPVGGMVVEPTFPMVRKVLLPAFRQFLDKQNIPWRYNKNEHVLTVRLAGKWCEIQLDSAHDPERLKGPNIAYAIVDEAGICDPGVWDHLPARVRHEDAKVAQFIAVGTPEGFGAFYEWAEGKWGETHEDRGDGVTYSPDRGIRRVLRAETYDNIFLKDGPDAYIRKRLSHLDQSDLDQYVRGLFVAKGSRVYRGFLEKDNARLMRLGNGRILVGADFNVARMCWVYGEKTGSEGLHIAGELVRYDTTTEAQGRALSGHLRDRLERDTGRQWAIDDVIRRTTIHCDPSAKNRSVRAEKSDVEQLRAMGFTVECNRSPIPIKDRVASVDWRLRERHLTVDTVHAGELTRSLKQQGRDRNGEPEKKYDSDDPDADLSGPPDALGYLVWAHHDWRVTTPKGNSITMGSYV